MKKKVLLLLWLINSTNLSAQTSPSHELACRFDSVASPHTISVKTNSLGYGLLILNVAAEIDLSSRLSISLPIYYSGWDYFHVTTKFRVFSVQPELRYWLPRAKGLFLGGHFGLTYFNIATNGRYRYQDTHRSEPAWGAGAAIGYRTYFKRDSRWFVEFSAGLGVYDVRYEKFINEWNGRQTSSSIHTTYFGSDQLSVSFGYSFDWHKPKNYEK